MPEAVPTPEPAPAAPTPPRPEPEPLPEAPPAPTEPPGLDDITPSQLPEPPAEPKALPLPMPAPGEEARLAKPRTGGANPGYGMPLNPPEFETEPATVMPVPTPHDEVVPQEEEMKPLLPGN